MQGQPVTEAIGEPNILVKGTSTHSCTCTENHSSNNKDEKRSGTKPLKSCRSAYKSFDQERNKHSGTHTHTNRRGGGWGGGEGMRPINTGAQPLHGANSLH